MMTLIMTRTSDLGRMTSNRDRVLPVTVLISGGGTTLINLHACQARGDLPIDIRLVIASRPGIVGIERAQKLGLPVTVIERRAFENNEAFGAATFDAIRQSGSQWALLAGYLRLLPIPVDFTNRVLNIHPSLLPAFGGKGMHGQHVHEAVLAHGAKVTGCTVHFVNNEFDAGPIVVQHAVTVAENDTPATLAARVFEAECKAYPEAISLVAQGRVAVDGRRVHITPLDEE
jgi:phosphoribosylglycinamide formyltransferase 1